MDIPEGDHVITEGRAWFTIGGFAVCIQKTDEGVVCDIYQNGRELEDSLASCYAFDNELKAEETET